MTEEMLCLFCFNRMPPDNDGTCPHCKTVIDWPEDEVELRIEFAAEKLQSEQLRDQIPYEDAEAAQEWCKHPRQRVGDVCPDCGEVYHWQAIPAS